MDILRVYVKSEGFVEKAIGAEKVLVPLTDNVADMNKVYNLNEVASFIYDTIDGEKSIAELCNILTFTYEVTQEEALRDIIFLLNDMVSRGVLFIKQKV